MERGNKEPTPTPSVWMRQMKVSGYAMLAGVAVLAYTIPQLRHGGEGGLPHGLLILSVVGGLMVFGGLFSCALALLFHLWHKRSDD